MNQENIKTLINQLENYLKTKGGENVENLKYYLERKLGTLQHGFGPYELGTHRCVDPLDEEFCTKELYRYQDLVKSEGRINDLCYIPEKENQ